MNLGEATQKRKIRPASIKEHLRHREEKMSAGKHFPEDSPGGSIDDIDGTESLQARLREAGSLPPEGRAELGGLVGAHLGNKVAGAHGSLIGAAIGSDSVRGLGMAQSGENQVQQRQAQVLDVFAKTKVLSKKGQITFKDGGTLSIDDGDTPVLVNVAPNIQGAPKRTIYEADQTNPLTKKTANVVLPLSYFLVGGILQEQNIEDPMVMKSIDSTATLLINAFQNDAKSFTTVLGRAQEVTKKLGMTRKNAEAFFYQNRDKISAKDAQRIKVGLDAIFRK